MWTWRRPRSEGDELHVAGELTRRASVKSSGAWRAGHVACLMLGSAVRERRPMTDDSAIDPKAMSSTSMMSAMPPGMLMWAGLYTAIFYVCGGMIAYMYRPN